MVGLLPPSQQKPVKLDDDRRVYCQLVPTEWRLLSPCERLLQKSVATSNHCQGRLRAQQTTTSGRHPHSLAIPPQCSPSKLPKVKVVLFIKVAQETMAIFQTTSEPSDIVGFAWNKSPNLPESYLESSAQLIDWDNGIYTSTSQSWHVYLRVCMFRYSNSPSIEQSIGRFVKDAKHKGPTSVTNYSRW